MTELRFLPNCSDNIPGQATRGKSQTLDFPSAIAMIR